MEQHRIEYLRRGARQKGRKKGVLYCGIDPKYPTNVVMGFSMCHSIDRFDYVKKQRESGFGLRTATKRACKWRDHTDYFVQLSHTEGELELGDELFSFINPDVKSVIEIPPSVIAPLKKFIERCRSYYKDKDFPTWIEKIQLDMDISETLSKESFVYLVKKDEVFNDDDLTF